MGSKGVGWGLAFSILDSRIGCYAARGREFNACPHLCIPISVVASRSGTKKELCCVLAIEILTTPLVYGLFSFFLA